MVKKDSAGKPLKAAKTTVVDFANSTTIHGISYVCGLSIKLLDRVLWFLLVSIGVFLAVLLVHDAYKTWKADPVLTSVGSTGLPLEKIEYPTITICSQGIIQDVLNKAMDKQFKDYVASKGYDLDEMSEEEINAAYQQDLFPGSITSPSKMINVLVSENPTESVKAGILTNPGSDCVDVPVECEPPWFKPLITDNIMEPNFNICVANLGLGKNQDEDPCYEHGGETLYFSEDGYGKHGEYLYTMLAKGELADYSDVSFWYSNYFDDGISYSSNGDPMNELVEFQYNEFDESDLPKNVDWCAIATRANVEYYFNYTLVECDGDTQAYRFCMRYAKNCDEETNQPSTVGSRKKREDEPVGSLDTIFLQSKQIERNNKAQQAKIAYKSNFRKMNLEKSYKALFEILWYTQLPCFDVEGVTSDRKDQYGMLKACFWKGFRLPCSKIFQTFPTENGMCCAFNAESADQMFQQGQYQEMVNFMQNRDVNTSFDRNMTMPAFWQEQGEPIAEAGRSKGLQVILDAHSDMVSGGTVSEDFDGFYAIIDGKGQFPMTTRKSVLIRPGHNNFVSIGSSKISADENIKTIEAKKRNCMFPKDLTMDAHNNYTQANCIFECQLKYALSQMNISDPCLPWYFPINQKGNARLCDPWEAREFRIHMQTVPTGHCDYCLPDCRTTIFTASVTAAQFRRCDYKNLGVSFLCNFERSIEPPIWGQSVIDQYESDIEEVPEFVSRLVKTNVRQYVNPSASGTEMFKAVNEETPEYDAYHKDIALVTFFFESSTVFEYNRVERMTMVGFISQIGGLLGLFLGFSFISAFEILYWFTIRFFRNMY